MKKLHEKASKLNIELDEHQLSQFRQYYEMLIEKNKVMNLTAITEFEEVIDKHFMDSLLLTNVMDLSSVKTVIDVGTGAGFPGIPLKLAFPHLEVTLLDSLNKRVGFLNEVIDALSLSGIQAVHSRAEEGARNKAYRDHFDLCVSRAVANLQVLSEYCLPYVRLDGHFISYKSKDIEEELAQSKNAIHILGGSLEQTYSCPIPDTEILRQFVIIRKVQKTPKAYPRKAGTAAKSPIQ
ncbi:MAG: 16S rRNA (guanine(527)-N(7))-methyltransferase RsmG [Lachnospiraceae bacterium]|nr:16S rRNA (guanine(527)-N(7))-methyltransferase RsmG [Lachnospiraceae bacterium]